MTRYEAANLAQDHGDCNTANERTFAAHVRSGDDGKRLLVATENKIVGNITGFQRVFHDGVPGKGVKTNATQERVIVPQSLGVEH